MQGEVINLLLKSFNEKKNSHAFLMETNNLESALNDILELIKKVNNIDVLTEECPDLKIVRPESKEIKKEQIKEIITNFQTFPFILKHKYYIIVSSELMNPSSANVLLKFLEEPDNQVIGFFLTTNRKAMINTIVSRCQSYKLFYSLTLEKNSLVHNFINSLKTSKFKRILFLNEWVSKDRAETIMNLKEIRNFLINDIKKNDIKLITKRYKLIDKCIYKLNRNANQELVILEIARKW